jgi:hypothetical protein
MSEYIRKPHNIGSGFTFVTSEIHDGELNTFVVLGARESEYSPTGMEYVTGITDSFAPRAGWSWGHYFNEFDKAVEDLRSRGRSSDT